MTLKQANYDYERIQYNTVVSAGMKMLNTLEALPADARGGDALRARRHVASCCACSIRSCRTPRGSCGASSGSQRIGDILDAPWPQSTTAALAQDEIELVLQVNGKLRGKLVVPATADKAAIEAAARASPEVAKHADGAPVKKVIVVPGRLVNVVVCLGSSRADCLGLVAAVAARARGLRLPAARHGEYRSHRSTSMRRRRRHSTTRCARALAQRGQREARRHRGGRAGHARHPDRAATTRKCCRCRRAGAVREFQLIKRVSFRLHDNDGGDWMPPGEISSAAPTRSTRRRCWRATCEEQRLQRDMQTDAIQQIVRRLQSARKPA